MSPRFPSAGVFPMSSSAAAARFGELQYRTTNMTEMPWRVASQEDAGENFLEVHFMGKRKTKYMDMQRSSAPLLTPNAATSRSVYVNHGIDDGEGRATAARMKFKASGPMVPTDSNSGPMHTAYGSAFARCSENDMRFANQESARPRGRTSPLATLDKLMETRSHAHSSFSQRAPHPSVPWHSPTTLGPVARGPVQFDGECSIYQKEFPSPPSSAAQRSVSSPLAKERNRRAEGLKLRQVFKENDSEPSGAVSAASGHSWVWRPAPASPAPSRASPARSQASSRGRTR